MSCPRPLPLCREPLSRERAVRAAVALTDAGGLHSLSMRKLAAALGVEAMSLYHHVSGKEDILDGMVDLVHGEISTPATGVGWKVTLRERARAMLRALARHPWASHISARASPGRATLRHHDAVIGCLRQAGFSMPMAGHALSLVDSYVHGFASRSCPHLAATAAPHLVRAQYPTGEEFEFGLGVLLEGIAAAHDAEGQPGELGVL